MSINRQIGSLIHSAVTLIAAFSLQALAFAAGPPEGLLSLADPNVKAVIAVQNAVTGPLMSEFSEILGTAVGAGAAGEAELLVFVNVNGENAADVAAAVPAQIRGKGVRVVLTDEFRAMPKGGGGDRGGGKPGGGGGETVSHTAIQTPPIKLGTSGGWGDDLANGYCCGGTLGSLVQVGADKYILSNYHVFEADIVPGGNGTTATLGDSIIQPGLIDVACNENSAQTVATLVPGSSLPNSNVDAALALVNSGMVDSSGSILEIGTISSQTVGASINQAVKKSGRTSGLTKSKVTGLNATVSVAYDNECAGGPAFTKTFTGQVIIANKGTKFLAGGDSGSLMVEDVDSNPGAVGLLFAGSKTIAVANPIDDVLSYFGATMVGN